MRFHKDAGYGAIGVQGTPFRGTGKIFIVGDSSTVNLSMLQELWTIDQDGVSRFFTTIDAAVGACTADAGDIIFVMPGHTETMAAAQTILADIAGISIIGIGRGSLRPNLNYTSENGTLAVTARDITIKNLRFTTDAANVTTAIDIGAAKDCTIEDCEWFEDTANENFLACIRTNATANSADGLTVKGCRVIISDVDGQNFIKFRNNEDRITVKDCFISMGANDDDGVIEVPAGNALTNVDITWNRVKRLQTRTVGTSAYRGLFISANTTTNSGIVAYNIIHHATDTAETLISLTGAGMFENYGTAMVTTSGFLRPQADA